MAVEVTKSGDRQIVKISWDKSIVTGEVVQLFCVNPDNGDISNSGLSRNDGEGAVSYPLDYSGTTEVTVYDNDGNADFGVIVVGEDGEVEQPEPPPEPTHPIVLPPDSGLTPEHPIALPDPHPEHPIVLPPLGIWPNPPEGSVGPEHPIAPGGEPPTIWPEPGIPTHPIVIPPDPDDDFWTGNLPPFHHPAPVK